MRTTSACDTRSALDQARMRSGSAALAAASQKGDKLVTTPNTYIATAMALSMHGIVPVFCDIDPETYNMDPDHLERVLSKEPDVRLCIPCASLWSSGTDG